MPAAEQPDLLLGRPVSRHLFLLLSRRSKRPRSQGRQTLRVARWVAWSYYHLSVDAISVWLSSLETLLFYHLFKPPTLQYCAGSPCSSDSEVLCCLSAIFWIFPWIRAVHLDHPHTSEIRRQVERILGITLCAKRVFQTTTWWNFIWVGSKFTLHLVVCLWLDCLFQERSFQNHLAAQQACAASWNMPWRLSRLQTKWWSHQARQWHSNARECA